MSSPTFEKIRAAIVNRQQVRATYGGRTRQLCPHLLGWKGGAERCLFYQFGGGSASGLGAVGSPANWRCLPLVGLTVLDVRDGPWHTAPVPAEQRSTCLDRVAETVASLPPGG